jgi:hypothetical protein
MAVWLRFDTDNFMGMIHFATSSVGKVSFWEQWPQPFSHARRNGTITRHAITPLINDQVSVIPCWVKERIPLVIRGMSNSSDYTIDRGPKTPTIMPWIGEQGRETQS